MARELNTDSNGKAWSEQTKNEVWKKGRSVPDYSDKIWRYDKCGKLMKWSEHGNRNANNGWEIDHIDPVSNGGGDNLNNLQPLQWKNNSDKGDKLNWNCR